jgi:hypothetical protein
MRLEVGRPIEAAGLRSGDRVRLTRQLEQAVRIAFIAEL